MSVRKVYTFLLDSDPLFSGSYKAVMDVYNVFALYNHRYCRDSLNLAVAFTPKFVPPNDDYQSEISSFMLESEV